MGIYGYIMRIQKKSVPSLNHTKNEKALNHRRGEQTIWIPFSGKGIDVGSQSHIQSIMIIMEP